MINMIDPLAVRSSRQHEETVATKFEHQNRTGVILKTQDMLGTTEIVIDAGRSNAGRPKSPIRLTASLLYLFPRVTILVTSIERRTAGALN